MFLFFLVTSFIAFCSFVAGIILDQSSARARGIVGKIAWKTLGRPLLQDQTVAQRRAIAVSGLPDFKYAMIGDSLTQFMDWGVFLGRKDVLNLGVAGDTTSGILTRVRELNISNKHILLMGGVNDAINGFPVEKTIENLKAIVTLLNATGNKVYLQSTIMTRRSDLNDHIRQLSARQCALCEVEGCIFVDVNSAVTYGVALSQNDSVDFVHLNFNGYQKWKGAIASIFAEPRV